MESTFFILLPLVLLVAGGLAGLAAEQRHLRDLTAREAASTHVIITDLRSLPPGTNGSAGALVLGNAVIATDYFKRFLASFRNLVGGEVKSYRLVMDRGRREARLRMIAEAAALGATLIINVRFTTADVANGAVEVICYGTAVRTGR
ncbi:MAG TPA: YbjQ family protein [Euzebya sp.]|nr:YbjQ family protein [Euzebya sp.]